MPKKLLSWFTCRSNTLVFRVWMYAPHIYIIQKQILQIFLVLLKTYTVFEGGKLILNYNVHTIQVFALLIFLFNPLFYCLFYKIQVLTILVFTFKRCMNLCTFYVRQRQTIIVLCPIQKHLNISSKNDPTFYLATETRQMNSKCISALKTKLVQIIRFVICGIANIYI